jgi:hypothetical protein
VAKVKLVGPFLCAYSVPNFRALTCGDKPNANSSKSSFRIIRDEIPTEVANETYSLRDLAGG